VEARSSVGAAITLTQRAADCSADALCSCAELTSTGNWCDEATRSINQPCA